jgi:hypothetical protein
MMLHSLIANRYEEVILPVTENQIDFFSKNMDAVSKLSVEEKLDLLNYHFPDFERHPSFVEGVIIENKLSFEKLDEAHKSLGFWDTENFITKNLSPFHSNNINIPSIKIQIFSQGNTLTYHDNGTLKPETLLHLEGCILPDGGILIQKIDTPIVPLSEYLKFLLIKYTEFRFTLIN